MLLVDLLFWRQYHMKTAAVQMKPVIEMHVTTL